MERSKAAQLYVDACSKEVLRGLAQRAGMTQAVAFQRIMSWLGSQTEGVQQLVLGQIPANLAPGVTRAALRRMAAPSGAGEVTSATERAAVKAGALVEAVDAARAERSARRRGRAAG
jgi:hypothetical protein